MKKVFISSVIKGMDDFRAVAEEAAFSLDFEAIRAEGFPAGPDTPQIACLTAVRQANVVLLLLGGRYGDKQKSGLSATHEEYNEARERCPVLVFVQDGIERDEDQQAFVDEAQDWSSGQYTARFTNESTLRSEITRALHQLELSIATGPVDEEEMLRRGMEMTSELRDIQTPSTVMALTGGPFQAVLRPVELEDRELAGRLKQAALFGDHRIFPTEQGTQGRISDHSLILEQDDRSILVNEMGSIRIVLPIRSSPDEVGGIIEERVQEGFELCLQYASWCLGQIDSSHRLSHCCPVAAIMGVSYEGWMREKQLKESHGGIPVRMGDPPPPVHLSPPHVTRAALRNETRRIATDLMVLVRRLWKPYQNL